jgi:cytoskeletal protein CcmA (bactofilin family)
MFKRNPSDGPKASTTPKNTVETLIGQTTRIEGDIAFSGGLRLDGQVAGNVRAMGEGLSVLIVSERGRIEGSVEVAHLILNGAVTGDVVARERVELGPESHVLGNVYYGVIEMAPGARISGKLVHYPAGAQPGEPLGGSTPGG